MNLILDLKGYTNDNVVKCMYDRGPLDFFAIVGNDEVLNEQLQILKCAWPNITKKTFLEDVCSSTLEQRIWLNRQKLVFNCNLKLFIKEIDIGDINDVLEYSILERPFTNLVEIKEYFNNLKYPTLEVDFLPLILKKCNPYRAGLKKNMLYYLSKSPEFQEI